MDGFQGQEKDIIILSTVRSGPGLTSIGFLRDQRRMNVALTRAKSSLFVIGNAATLERCDERWRTIVGDARERGFLINVSGSFDRADDVVQVRHVCRCTSRSPCVNPGVDFCLGISHSCCQKGQKGA